MTWYFVGLMVVEWPVTWARSLPYPRGVCIVARQLENGQVAVYTGVCEWFGPWKERNFLRLIDNRVFQKRMQSCASGAASNAAIRQGTEHFASKCGKMNAV
mgnify:CR=1 FL=1